MFLAFIFGINVVQAILNAGVLTAALVSIFAACAVINKTFVGRGVRWFWRRIFTDPLVEKFERRVGSAVQAAVAPQLEIIRQDAIRLEGKNDRQHGENKKALDDLNRVVHNLKWSVEDEKIAHQGHVRGLMNGLEDIKRMYAAHLREAAVRDEKIAALEALLHEKD